MGLASARRGSPPPNSSASALLMKDQVTASTSPRAASARLARRVRFCSSPVTSTSMCSLMVRWVRGFAVSLITGRIGLPMTLPCPVGKK